ncbi:Uracil DNA glycosylase superfamily protein [Granulibacter bethesdensis]|uniref:Type-4 uracil-DNA glycosylase n=1 Tax=Granulibacter bethesdensis TaxID=364410 RepID=A0AAC9KF21_9PROT|nr:uracil-DNA glycosylase [Granulibacter bethesdensis]APH55163.1 Uracil DNA glycosylase superfamily protein [Granulibacter bethesdensis]APH62748.1 Uracil DNA glycosylase superfamily protein [Granulibacter bethesdensis]
MDALAALHLQLEWGADEALGDSPVDRFAIAMASAQAPSRIAPADLHPVSAAAPQPEPHNIPVHAVQRPAAFAGKASLLPQQGAARLAADIAAEASTLDALRAAMEQFDACPLKATATQLVFSDGTYEAGLMLIGEAPGAEEDRAGKPFVGPSGKFLDRMLASAGITRERDFVIANLIPWRPPGNRNPTETEILQCLPFLLRHIVLARPRMLVCLGGVSAKALTGSTVGIRRLRGKWTDIAIPGLDSPLPMLPMLHPAYLLRNPGAKREAWADILSLRKALDG